MIDLSRVIEDSSFECLNPLQSASPNPKPTTSIDQFLPSRSQAITTVSSPIDPNAPRIQYQYPNLFEPDFILGVLAHRDTSQTPTIHRGWWISPMFHVNGFRVLESYWAPWAGVEGATASLHTSREDRSLEGT